MCMYLNKTSVNKKQPKKHVSSIHREKNTKTRVYNLLSDYVSYFIVVKIKNPFKTHQYNHTSPYKEVYRFIKTSSKIMCKQISFKKNKATYTIIMYMWIANYAVYTFREYNPYKYRCKALSKTFIEHFNI